MVVMVCENTYPGVRGDIPANVYPCTFDPDTQWTEEFAQGAEISDYWRNFSQKYVVYHYLRLVQCVDSINWDDDGSEGRLQVGDVQTSETYEEMADFRFNS